MKLIELKLNKNLGWFLFLITFIVLIFIAINQNEIVREEYRDPELSTTWEDAIKLELNTKLKQANILLARYFNANEIIVTSYKDGPAGTLIFTAKIDGNIKQFYMLTDNEHLIEGTIFSPYLTSNNLVSKHNKESSRIAAYNQNAIEQKSALKSEFMAKVENNNSDDSNAHVTNANNNSTDFPSAFKLPELNSVISSEDKEKFFEITQNLQNISLGDENAPVIYVYFDFDCPACRLTKTVLKKYTDTGQLLVKYIPVGLISPDSPIKAAYTLIPEKNNDRVLLMDYFVKKGTAEELITKKAPKSDVLRGIGYVRDANKAFMFTPKKLTPTFIFKLNNEVVIANLTSEKSIQDLVDRLNLEKNG